MTRIATALAVTAAAASASASTWEIDSSHSHVGFSVKHMMVTNVRGRFKTVKGTIEVDEKDPSRTKISAEIDAASIDTDAEDRDKHLKSADFFDVEKHPRLTFVSKSVKAKGKDRLAVTGDLTMRGVTKEVVLDVTGLTGPVATPWGGTKRGAVATTKVNRKDFGLVWQKSLDKGGVLVGDEVTITLEIELDEKKPAPKS